MSPASHTAYRLRKLYRTVLLRMRSVNAHLFSDSPAGAIRRRGNALEELEPRMLLSVDLTSAVESAMINYANAGPQEVTVAQASLGDFLAVDSITIRVNDATVDGLGQLLSGSATLWAADATLFPAQPFTAAITDSDDADDLAVLGTFDVSGGFSLGIDLFKMTASGAFIIDAAGFSMSYDPAAVGSQTLVSLSAGTISFPQLAPASGPAAVQGPLSGLDIRTDGFELAQQTVISVGEITVAGQETETLLSMTGLGLEVQSFAVSFGPTLAIAGGIEVFAGSASLFANTGLSNYEVSISDSDGDGKCVSAGFAFSSAGQMLPLLFTMDQMEAKLGTYVTLTAQDVVLDTGAAGDTYLLQVGEVTGTLEVPNLLLFGVVGGNFAITGSGQFVPLANFGARIQDSDFNDAVQQVGWPKWISVKVDQLGVTWPDFMADPSNLQIVLSGSIDGMFKDLGLPMTVGGSITNARFDLGRLLAGQFPVTSLDAASFNIGGKLFGVEVAAEGTLGMIRYDADFQEVTDPLAPYVDTVLYAGFGGKFEVPGFGIQVRLGFSELGPLCFYGYLDVPIVLEPKSGLSLGGFRAGASFFTSLPDPVDEYGQLDPTKLRGDEFAPPGEITWNTWSKNLRASALEQAQAMAGGGALSLLAAFTEPMVLTGGAKVFSVHAKDAVAANATVMLDTSGKIMLNANLEFAGGFEGVKGYFYGDLTELAVGTSQFAVLVDVPKEPRIVSVYGSLEMVVLDEDGLTIQTPGAGEASALQLRITGGGELSALGLAQATLDGKAVFTLSNLDQLLTTPENIALTMDVEARLSVTYLGDVGLASGHFSLDMYTFTDPDTGEETLLPELYGALYVRSDFSKFRELGIYAYSSDPDDPADTGASALLRFNASLETRTVQLTMPAEDPNAGAVYEFDLDPMSLDIVAMGGLMFRLGGVDWFDIEGTFYMGLNLTGLDVVLDGQVNLVPVSDDPSESLVGLSTLGLLSISPYGVAAMLESTSTDTIPPELNIDLAGKFVIALNTTSQDVSLEIPDTLPAVEGVRSFTIPGAPYPGDAAQPYLRVDAVADMNVLDVATLVGTFHMLALADSLEIEAHAASSFGLMAFTLDGALRLNSDGLVGALDVQMTDRIPDSWGFGLQADFAGEINTTGQDVTLAGVLLEKDHLFLFEGSGWMTAGGFVLDGRFSLAAEDGYLGLGVYASANVFGGTILISALGKLYYETAPGIVIDVAAGIDPNDPLGLPGILTISAMPRLQLNTRTIASDALPAYFAKVSLTGASMKLLGVLSFSGSGSVIYSSGMFELRLDDFSTSFFGLATFGASGWIRGDGQFSLAMNGSFFFGGTGLGVSGDGNMSISYVDDVFSLSGSAGGSFWFLGGRLASTSAGFAYNSGNNNIWAHFRVWTFLTGTVRFDIYIGSISPAGMIEPEVINLAALQGDGTLLLYVGDDAGPRGIEATDETYVVSRLGAGTSGGEKLEVSALGRTQQFDNVLRISANAGSGDDDIRLMDDVSIPAVLDGGEGNDVLQGGAGDDQLYGGAGDDLLIGGAGSDLLAPGSGADTVRGGAGNDRYILAAGVGPVTLTDDAGSDTLDYGAYDGPVTVNLETMQATGLDGSFAGIENLVGSAQSDQLIGPDAGATFVIDAANSGSVAGVMFTSFENPAGGLGQDTLDFGAYAGPVTVNLETMQATALDGMFAGIENLIGSAQSDQLIGPDAGATFVIDAANRGSVAGVTFTSFENLAGGAGEDTLDYGAYEGTVVVNLETTQATALGGGFAGIENFIGGDQDDQLIGPDAGATFILDAAGDGSAAGVTFASFESLTGGTGSDTFVLPGDADVPVMLDGGAGSDTLDCSAATAAVQVDLGSGFCSLVHDGLTGAVIRIESVRTGAGDDTLTGGEEADVLSGGAGNDTLRGLDGDDTLDGGPGDDTMDGGAGNDVYIETPGSRDAVLDSGGVDELDFSGAAVGIRLNLGHGTGKPQEVDVAGNVLRIYGTIENVIGSTHDDLITGNAVANHLVGLGGDDRLTGLDGEDELEGGDGQDLLYGGNGADRLDGGAGDDCLRGQEGNDVLRGGDGADTLIGGVGDDELYGEQGDDRLFDGDGNDRLDGGPGQDAMVGGDGHDVLVSGSGDDILRGKGGHDLADYSQDAAGMQVNLAAGVVTDGWGSTDSISGIGTVYGSSFADTLVGGRGADSLYGLGGDDVIRGGGGSDRLFGGPGPDTVFGEGGDDQMLWSEGDGQDTDDGGPGRDALHVMTDQVQGQQLGIASANDSARVFRANLTPFAVMAGRVEMIYLNGSGGDDTVGIRALTGAPVMRLWVDLGGGDDRLEGVESTVAMRVLGSAGQDVFRGGRGHDLFDGGPGLDTADYSLAASGVRAFLSGRTGSDGLGGSDCLVGVEGLLGSSYDDLLIGCRPGDTITGGGGQDRILGAAAQPGALKDRVHAGDGGVDLLASVETPIELSE